MKKKRDITKIKYLFLLLPLLISLSSCDSSQLGDQLGNGIEEKLLPNIRAFLVQLIAFVLLLIAVIFLAYKPVKKFLEKRSEMLEEEVKTTHENRQISEEKRVEMISNLANAKAEATKIINEATKEATIAKDKIISDANDERRQLKEKTMNEISLEKEKAMKELKDQIVDVAFEASSKILEREVNSLDNKKIVDNFVEDLNKN
ncbi:MAG: F0F1 ATP synthase subunit B [Candidatus Onthovivens sp.]